MKGQRPSYPLPTRTIANGWRRRRTSNGLLAPKFPVSMFPQEGKARRYPSYDERRNYKMPFNSELWGFDWDPYQNGK